MLKSHLDTYLVSNSAKSFLCTKDDIRNIPHLLVFARTPFLTQIYVEQFLKTRFSLKNRNFPRRVIEKEFNSEVHGKHHISYLDCHYYIELDVSLFANMPYDKRVLVDFLKSIVFQQNVVTGKHIVYIKGLQNMSLYSISSLMRLIEASQENATFIMGSIKTFTDSKLLSFCCHVNANVHVARLTHDLVQAIRKKNLHLQQIRDMDTHTLEKMLLHHAHGDIVNVALLLDIPQPHLYIGYLQKTIEAFLHRLTDIKDGDAPGYMLSQLVKDMSVKMSASCVPFCDFAHDTIRYFLVKYPDKVHQVVSLSAYLDHMAVLSNKEVFCYEDFFFRLAGICS